MQDAADARWRVRENQRCAFRGELTDADEPFGPEDLNNFAQVLVAPDKKGFALARWRFVRRAITAARFDKSQRAVVADEVFGENFSAVPNRPANNPHKRWPLTSLRRQSKPVMRRFGCSCGGLSIFAWMPSQSRTAAI
jgi:hypothetical protein